MSIDLSEPWRYACPDCGSVAIKRNVGGEKVRVASYSGERGKHENFRLSTDIRCPQCGATFDEPVDKKTADRNVV